MQSTIRAVSFIPVLLLLCLPACGQSKNEADKPPTEAEVIKYFVKWKEDSAMHDVLRPAKKVETTVSDIKIGSKIKKQVGRGEDARDVWAVKANLLTKIYLKNGTEQTREHRLESNEAWFFYRDGFGEWTAKFGPM
jgi:hypothetical protein